MKKLGIFAVCTLLLVSMQVIAKTEMNMNMNMEQKQSPKVESQCPQANEVNGCDKFLCTNTNIEEVFTQTGLSDSQICTARKLQEKYEQETLSVNDRLTYEEGVLNEYNSTCSKNSEIRQQKRKIKNLQKTRKDICKCYEKQFKVMLSNAQWKEYNRIKK